MPQPRNFRHAGDKGEYVRVFVLASITLWLLAVRCNVFERALHHAL